MRVTKNEIASAFEKSKGLSIPDDATLRRLFVDVDLLSELAFERVIFPIGRHLPRVTVSGPISDTDITSSMICFLIGVALKARGLRDQVRAIESYRATTFPALANSCAAQAAGLAVSTWAFQPEFEAFLVNLPEISEETSNVTKH